MSIEGFKSNHALWLRGYLESLTPAMEKFLKESQAFYTKNGQTILEKLDEAISQDTPVKRSDLEELKRVKARVQEGIDFFKPFEGKEISLEFLETSPYYQITSLEESGR